MHRLARRLGRLLRRLTRRPLLCDFGRHPISRKHYRLGDGDLICTDCRRSRSRCAGCTKPLHSNERTPSTDGAVCDPCAGALPRCHGCGRAIVGPHSAFGPDRADIFCNRCCRTRERCDVCSLPAEEAHRLDDGRVLCGSCRATAVFDAREAAALFRRVAAALRKRFGMSVRTTPDLHLVGASEIAELRKTVFRATRDFDERAFGVFVRRGECFDIHVEYGLPRVFLIAVLAHEHTHAWQAENCPRDTSPEVREGFAEWVAYHVVGGMRQRKVQRRMTARTDLYGTGLRLMLEREREMGRAELVRRARDMID